MSDRTVFHLPERGTDYGEGALGNVSNLLADETVDAKICVVANGGGVEHLLDGAPSADHVRALLDQGVDLCACSNTLRKADDVDESDLIEGVTVVSSGMGELTRLQADGYGYIRP